MLVSSIARFNAISNMHNASMNMMNTMNSMMGAFQSNTFGGEHNLEMLHQIDKKNSLDLASNSLLYKLSYLQEKAAAKRQALELKNSKLDLMA